MNTTHLVSQPLHRARKWNHRAQNRVITEEEEFVMERPATWKVVTLGTALAGLGVAGGPGATPSDSGSPGSAPRR